VATIRPFAGIHYAHRPDLDLSNVIAPPYDVLDVKEKAALQAKHPNNIVTVDLPWLPPKTVGPDQAYDGANVTLQAWLSAGVLKRDARPALYPYTQTYDHAGKTFHRRGFFAVVRLSPFGKGEVVPHEMTYASAIEDRLKLMRATGVQLSPIFGLFSDPNSEVTKTLYAQVGRPQFDATMDGIRNQLWTVNDSGIISKVEDLMARKPVYIADGHHRYTTALQYQKEAEQKNRAPLPPEHPANYCLFSLVSMQDDGLLILPTHRLIGGLQNFDINKFKSLVANTFDVAETSYGENEVDDFIDGELPKQPPHTFGLYDGKAKKLYQLTLKNEDVLKPFEPQKSDAWRRLDVAILQRYLLDEVIAPNFGTNKEITKGYTAYANHVAPQVDGSKFQIALLLRSTPLHALEELGKHNEVMPQKSTFFYPKLATGMVINPLR
jgi:uncharacterized protein (DUF1015 family)